MFQISLPGPDLDKLAQYSDEHSRSDCGQIPGLADVDSTLSLRKPEVQVAIDRERASDLGIPVQTVANTLNVLVGGPDRLALQGRDASSTTSGCGPTSRSGPTRRRWRR